MVVGAELEHALAGREGAAALDRVAQSITELLGARLRLLLRDRDRALEVP